MGDEDYMVKTKEVLGLFVAQKEEEKKEAEPEPVVEAAPEPEEDEGAKKKKEEEEGCQVNWFPPALSIHSEGYCCCCFDSCVNTNLQLQRVAAALHTHMTNIPLTSSGA